MATNIFKKVSINGQEYLVKKFDAMTGLKLARLIIAKAAPLIPLLDSTKSTTTTAEDDRVYSAVGAILGTLTDADIEDLVKKCLSVCYADLPAGKQAIIDETGHYGIEDVEYDMSLTIRLCFEAIKWGASDFFGEKGSSLMQLMK